MNLYPLLFCHYCVIINLWFLPPFKGFIFYSNLVSQKELSRSTKRVPIFTTLPPPLHSHSQTVAQSTQLSTCTTHVQDVNNGGRLWVCGNGSICRLDFYIVIFVHNQVISYPQQLLHGFRMHQLMETLNVILVSWAVLFS